MYLWAEAQHRELSLLAEELEVKEKMAVETEVMETAKKPKVL